MVNLGRVRPGRTIRIPWGSYTGSTGASSATTNYAAADILIYKDGGTTERASTAGFTATTTFDTLTGINVTVIDLADNTTAGFFAAGSEYFVIVGPVTIDTQTVNFPIARFVIGMEGAIAETTIATLASQTSFTLTTGPAEDNALNGCIAYIHDVASAVQCGMATVLAYTGSTLTVTLAAGTTFTVAATDNIMFFPRSNVHTVGGTIQTARDIGGAVPAATPGAPGGLFIAGTNAATTVTTALTTTFTGNLTGSVANVTGLTAATVHSDLDDIQARLPAALVGGRIDANVGAISSDATAADNAEAFFDGTGYAGTNNVIPTVTTTGTATAVTTVNGLAANVITAAATAADFGTEIAAAIAAITITELAAIPAASPTLAQALALLYMALRNKVDVTATAKEIHTDAGAVLATKTLSDDATTYSETKMA